ncbi:hypothetical protein TUM18999_57610 [Pseudomonas tohonis]|uniref:Uncharacterized protein n=1 Tax=Pseudomonas tohonis TaxID=2725477 RepID=A0A6J4ED72_9PSED|nr:hypothetical protein [Pseudomonas tohonis]BCG27570.1 hypothetical protein TUM18999_57610 [Pseudomonas tohonis]
MSNEKRGPLVMPATLEECASVMERLSFDCTNIRTQVEAAKANQRATGRYSDPMWFARATAALRWMSRDRQRLQEHMAKLRKASRAATETSRDKLLIEALRQHVSPEVFFRCVAEVTLQLPTYFVDSQPGGDA